MLTPEEIQTREFLVSLRGYDRDEVDAFRDEVAEAFASLLADKGGAGAPAAAAPAAAPAAEPTPAPAPAAAVSPFAAIGAETQRILEAAQEAGDEIRRKAQSEADEARDQAISQAEGEVARLREDAAAISAQIETLQQRRDEIADKLRQARETVDVALVELDGGTEPNPPADATNSVLAAEAPSSALDDDAAEADADDDEIAADGDTLFEDKA